MTTNNYAPCPCGSGKKMKFCKCVDQPHEYETIMRLLEGGQEVAALDRRDFGSLPEKTGRRMNLHVELTGGRLVDLLLEYFQASDKPVVFGACAGNSKLHLCSS